MRFRKKNEIGDPPLNLEIADLRDFRALRGGVMGRSSRSARQPYGVAFHGTGRKLYGRGFKSRYDEIEDPLRKE